jgi:hypothetical protein
MLGRMLGRMIGRMIPPMSLPIVWLTTLPAATLPQPKTLRPLRQPPQPVADESRHDAHDCDGAAAIEVQTDLPGRLYGVLRWTQAPAEPVRQLLQLAPRFLAIQPRQRQPELKPRRWVRCRWDRCHRIWVARARAPRFLPWQACLPTFFGASSARLSICAYSCL